MESIDRMILNMLQDDLKCSFENDTKIKSLNDLDSEQIVEGIVRCLWKCNPNTIEQVPSYKLTGNTVDRFRIASKITDEIKFLKIREQIGYQALLYPNVFDSRRILLALFEKLPKETIKVDEIKMNSLEKIKSDVANVIAQQIAEHWIPEFCRFYDLQRVGRFWHPRYEKNLFDGNITNIWNQFDLQFVWIDDKKLEQKTKPKIGPKPKLPTKPMLAEQKKCAENEYKTEEDEMQKKNFPNNGDNEIKTDEVDHKRTVVEEHQKILMELQNKISQKMDELQIRQKMAETIDERLLALLQDPTASLEKLKTFVAEASNRRQALQEKFFATKSERLEQLNQRGDKAIELVGIERLAALRQIIETFEQLLEQRKRIKAKLLKENKKATIKQQQQAQLVDSRNIIVRRILEISSMVAKQNNEICKTANSVQIIRKEIDQLEGNLDRTFTAVNRWLCTVADKSTKMQRTHKMLVRTHEQCALVKEAIQAQGELSRQIDELEDRVELETQKGVDAQLERLLEDLMLIRNENHELYTATLSREQQQ